MKKKDLDNISQVTEQELKKRPSHNEIDSEKDPEKMIHELRVHQIELEMQNEELKRTQNELERIQFFYEKLFQHAPVGYIVLTEEGRIKKSNFTFGKNLIKNQENIQNRHFYDFIVNEDRDIFYKHLRRLLDSGSHQRDELRLKINRDTLYVELHSSLEMFSGETKHILTTIINIQERKDFEAELNQSHEKLRNLSSHILSVREHESRRLARKIHDEIGQNLFSLQMDVFNVQQKIDRDQEEILHKLQHILSILDQTISITQHMTSELRPQGLDEIGLKEAIEAHARNFENQTGIPCKVILTSKKLMMHIDSSIALFRIFQEALMNIRRHSGADLVTVKLQAKKDSLELFIQDNGKGISQDAINNPRSFGILGMRERANMLGGSFHIEGIPGEFTTIVVRLPEHTGEAES